MPQKKGKKKSSSKGKKKGSKPKVTVRQAPIVYQTQVVTRRQPVQKTLPNGDVVVSHKELVGTVTSGGTAFLMNTPIPLNPGSGALSTWLAALSQQYESYLWEDLKFTYVPFLPTTYAGMVYLSADYDASDGSFENISAMMQTPGAVATQVSRGVTFHCRTKDLQKLKMYYVRTATDGTLNDLPATDARTSDAGFLAIATQAVTSPSGDSFASAIGQLWVEYRVKLMTPQPAAPVAALRAASAQVGTYTVPANTGYKVTTVYPLTKLGNGFCNFAAKGVQAGQDVLTAVRDTYLVLTGQTYVNSVVPPANSGCNKLYPVVYLNGNRVGGYARNVQSLSSPVNDPALGLVSNWVGSNSWYLALKQGDILSFGTAVAGFNTTAGPLIHQYVTIFEGDSHFSDGKWWDLVAAGLISDVYPEEEVAGGEIEGAGTLSASDIFGTASSDILFDTDGTGTKVWPPSGNFRVHLRMTSGGTAITSLNHTSSADWLVTDEQTDIASGVVNYSALISVPTGDQGYYYFFADHAPATSHLHLARIV